MGCLPFDFDLKGFRRVTATYLDIEVTDITEVVAVL